MKKAIVTGVTGAIGHALVDELIKQGFECFLLCRPNSVRNNSLRQHEKIHVIMADLRSLNESSLREILPNNCDVFFHLGWMAPFGENRNNMEIQIKNIQFTLDAVKLAKDTGCSVFVGAGSQAEYGRVEGLLDSKTPAFPENGYGMAKLCAGAMSRVECQRHGIKHIWARILSVYGPFDAKYTMISTAILKMLKDESTEFTKGDQIWDYLYSKDAARMLCALATGNSQDGHIYCVGNGEARPLKYYLEVIKKCSGYNQELGLGKIKYHDKQVMMLCANIEDIIKDVKVKPSITFEKGIAETIAWMKLEYSDEIAK